MSSTLGKTAAVVCLAGACAGGSPQVRTTSPEKACPQSTIELMTELGIKPPRMATASKIWLIPRFREDQMEIPVPPEGPFTAYVAEEPVVGIYGDAFPVGTRFHGTIFHGVDRFYGWLTEAEFPEGKRIPVCFQITYDQKQQMGMPFTASSTPERKMTEVRLEVTSTTHLGRM